MSGEKFVEYRQDNHTDNNQKKDIVKLFRHLRPKYKIAQSELEEVWRVVRAHRIINRVITKNNKQGSFGGAELPGPTPLESPHSLSTEPHELQAHPWCNQCLHAGLIHSLLLPNQFGFLFGVSLPRVTRPPRRAPLGPHHNKNNLLPNDSRKWATNHGSTVCPTTGPLRLRLLRRLGRPSPSLPLLLAVHRIPPVAFQWPPADLWHNSHPRLITRKR